MALLSEESGVEAAIGVVAARVVEPVCFLKGTHAAKHWSYSHQVCAGSESGIRFLAGSESGRRLGRTNSRWF
eukprot:6693785-Alexandrium_andersonii.AAC.1